MDASRNANMREAVPLLNHARREQPGLAEELIACRICDHIFTSSRALFDHMELHLLLDEANAKRQLLLSHMVVAPQSGVSANHLIQNHPPPPPALQQDSQQQPRLVVPRQRFVRILPYPPLPSAIHPFLLGAGAPQQWTIRPPLVSYQPVVNQPLPTAPTPSPTAAEVAATAARQIMRMSRSRTNLFTRPFLNQLEANLLIEGMAAMAERELEGDCVGDQEVDVTLKL
ncbi:hypothetical protein Gohar_027043 [Gossypium harknessii]|uniref:C2H2-type domain-containing protein n=1 Tax=Gossypium harknessii TaxID=34285 RepID=A0A7J9HU70_9ROSI|nr:hypothetical protein [Gossypium harknessii]